MFETVLQQLKDITGPRFYFLSFLIFLLALGYIFQEALTIVIKSKTFNELEFRECKNIGGLEEEMNKILVRHPNIQRYGVYLYQPKEKAFYKKLIMTNSPIAKASQALQGIYLKDQPSINAAFKENDYYLIDEVELQKKDLQYMEKIGVRHALFYKLGINDKIVGEVGIKFKRKPTTDELELLLQELSPLLYMYII